MTSTVDLYIDEHPRGTVIRRTMVTLAAHQAEHMQLAPVAVRRHR